LLASYLDHLSQHRGLGQTSLRYHRHGVSTFLAFLQAHGLTLGHLRVEDLDGYLHEVAQTANHRRVLSQQSGALRGFLRYLFAEGWAADDLSAFVASPRIYRDATVPTHFTWQEVERLVASVQGDDFVAWRDRAMLMLLATYGLRGGEIARLTLDDIDWTHDRIRVADRKSGPGLVLPLMPAVKAVLSHYVERVRPNVPCRTLLLARSGKPFHGPVAITERVVILAARAGLRGGRACHAIRRAVGTRLVEEGWGLGAVTQVLGHRSLRASNLYLRLSTELLRDVADNYGDLL